VIVLLALQDNVLPRSYVAGILWGDVTETRANGNLRTALWRLRSSNPALVEANGGGLALTRSIEVDLRQALQLANRFLQGDFAIPGDSGDEWTVPPDVFCRELLPGWYDDDWVIIEREHHRQLSLHATEALAEHLLEGGRRSLGLAAALAVTERDPLRESAQRLIICAHLRTGNISEAVLQYRRYEGVLHQELGLRPSADLRALLAASARDERVMTQA
jgi:DNA-binding SARP family transcriptional activator